MKDCKFKQLVINTYNDSKNRTFNKQEFGITATYNNYFGIIYGAISQTSFSDILDIDKYMDIGQSDMLLLVSRKTSQEVEIYEWKLKDYKFKEDILYIELDNKSIEFQL